MTETNNKLYIEYMPLSELRDRKHPRNPKDHNIGAIDSAMKTFGYTLPPMLDELTGKLAAGHGRIDTLTDAQRRGFIPDRVTVRDDGEWLIPVIRGLSFETPEQVEAYLVADNRLTELGGWHEAELAGLLQDLALQDEALMAATGYDLDDLDALLRDLEPPEPMPDPGAQVDRAAELRDKWQTERGQVWQVGRHRVMCGDSTNADDVARLGKSDVLITDPPYGINYDPKWLDNVGTHRKALSSRNTLVNDDGSLDLSFLFGFERRLIWGFPYIYDPEATGWIVWDKQPGVDRRGIVTPIEMASTTLRKGFDMIRCMWGGYYRAAGETSQPHPTQKAIGVIRPILEDFTNTEDVIYDPFLGSGTTLVACEQTNRVGYGMEIDPAYAAVCLERLTGMGLAPELQT